MIYKILQDAEIKGTDVWAGAVVASFLFVIVQFFVGINKSNITFSLGAIGSITFIFIRLIYSSLVFLFGADYTKIYAEKYDSFVERG